MKGRLQPGATARKSPKWVWWLYPLASGDTTIDRNARSVQAICLLNIGAILASIVMDRYFGDLSRGVTLASVIASVGVLLLAGVLVLNRRGSYQWAARLLSGTLMAMGLLLVGQARDGIRSIVTILIPALLVYSVTVLESLDYTVFASLTIVGMTMLGITEVHSAQPLHRSVTTYSTVWFMDSVLICMAAAGAVIARNARQYIAEIRAAAGHLATANATISASEQRYRSLIESAVDAIFVTDLHGVILESNSLASALTGLSPSELKGRAMASVFHASGDDPFPLETLRRGATVLGSCRIHGHDGAVDVELHSAAMPEGRIQCFCRDISDRIRAEVAQREAEERFRALSEHSTIGVYSVSEGKLDYANPALASATGYSLDELVGVSPLKFVLPDDQDLMLEHLRRWQAGEAQSGPYEVRILCRDGRVRRMEVHGTVVKLSQRAIVMGHMVDVTDRNCAQEALRDRTEAYETLVKCVPDLIWSMDLAGRYTWVSPSVERVYGWTPDEFLALTRDQLMTEAQLAKSDQILTQELQAARFPDYDHNRVITLESEQYRKDGSTILTEINASVIWADDGLRPVGWTGITRNISERKHAEAERAKLLAELAHAQKLESVGRLAGGVAHDFNNLLTVINGYSKLALSTLMPENPLHEYVRQIESAGERAAGVTRQLLAFSRKQVLQPRQLDLNRTVNEMMVMLQRLVGEDVRVSFAAGADVPVVRADPQQLAQIIMNLAVNARDAMLYGGQLLIETASVTRGDDSGEAHPGWESGVYALLAVTDTGCGMDEATLERIFEPFFTTKAQHHGTGLGLAMVQGIVAQSGGHIIVNTVPGRGTRFEIYLPTCTEAPEQATLAREPAKGGSEVVLVVEDQREVLDFVSAILTSYGYQIIPAASAEDALRVCERHEQRIDLILTDVVMPIMSGRELVEHARISRPGITALFMSGYTDDVISRHGVLGEGEELINKPFSPADLAIKVRELLGTEGFRSSERARPELP